MERKIQDLLELCYAVVSEVSLSIESEPLKKFFTNRERRFISDLAAKIYDLCERKPTKWLIQARILEVKE